MRPRRTIKSLFHVPVPENVPSSEDSLQSPIPPPKKTAQNT